MSVSFFGANSKGGKLVTSSSAKITVSPDTVFDRGQNNTVEFLESEQESKNTLGKVGEVGEVCVDNSVGNHHVITSTLIIGPNGVTRSE